MLEDRPYWRGSTFGNEWWRSATLVLMAVNLAVFVLQSINAVYLRWPADHYLALSQSGLAHGYFWQLVTFQFLHAGPTHFVINELMLFMFGRPVEEIIGRGRFLELYFAGGILGGLLQTLLGLAMPAHFGLEVVGASAGICALIAVYSLFEPNQMIFLWLVIPVPARFFVIITVAVSVFYILVPLEPQIAHAAHLGGILAGVLYLKWFIRPERRLFGWRRFPPPEREPELVSFGSGRRRAGQSAQVDLVKDVPSGDFISREVDPILDKISAQGIHSLTARERAILEAARKKMERK